MYQKVEEVAPGTYVPRLKLKSEGLVSLGKYSTDRLAAVAHDVARLLYIHEKRPGTDLRIDSGLHFPVDGYLVDPTFKGLLTSNTSFTEVCDLLRSGGLADQFLYSFQDRQTRATSSSTSGGAGPSPPTAASRGHSRMAPPAVVARPRPQAAPAQQQAAPVAPAPKPQRQPEREQQHGEQASAKPSPSNPPSRQPSGSLAAPQQATEAVPQRAAELPQQVVRSPSTEVPAAAVVGGADAPVPAPAPTPAPAPASTAAAEDGSPSNAGSKKKPMRWLEWPTKGGGQYATCISERALKNNMTLPGKMKRELFQVSGSQAPIAAYDLKTGSNLRWSWEVRDYVKDERSSTYIYNLAAFFKHYNACPGDVMVVVASAPGAVKATIWKGDSQDALQFKEHLDKQSRAGGGNSGGAAGSRKRPADGAPPHKPPAKLSKPAADAAAPARASGKQQQQQRQPADSGKQQEQQQQHGAFSAELSRQLSKNSSGPQQQQQQQQQPGMSVQQERPPASNQEPAELASEQQAAGPASSKQRKQQGSVPRMQTAPSQAQQPQQQQAASHSQPLQRKPSHQLQSDELMALADAGVDASHPSGGDDTMHLSPTAQVAQSPFRQQQQQLLGAAPLASTEIKQEQQSPPPEQLELPPAVGAAAGTAAAGGRGGSGGGVAGANGGGTVEGGVTYSPARMSCADASPTCRQPQQEQQAQLVQQRQHAAHQQQQQQVSGVQGQEHQQSGLPDAEAIANDEGAVYVAMSRLLNLVAGTGRVPVEAVSTYRRSFGRLEPAGRRWFHYDSLKQLVDAAEWPEVQQWLQCN